MSTFTNWNKLPAELREHSLSFCYTKELAQYAPLSHFCNNEIQKFNAIAPEYLHMRDLKHGFNGIMIHAKCSPLKNIYLYFVAASENTHKLVRSVSCLAECSEKFENSSIFAGNARDRAFQFLAKFLKYTTSTRIKQIKIECEEWIYDEFMAIPAILYVADWTVRMPLMYNEFMDVMDETTTVKKLILYTNRSYREAGYARVYQYGSLGSMGSMESSSTEEPESDREELTSFPAQFFESNFFKQLEYANLTVKTAISDDEFLSFTTRSLNLRCDTISEIGIARKMQQWYEKKVELNSFGIILENKKMDIDIILQNCPAAENNGGSIKIKRQDGAIGLLNIIRLGPKTSNICQFESSTDGLKVRRRRPE